MSKQGTVTCIVNDLSSWADVKEFFAKFENVTHGTRVVYLVDLNGTHTPYIKSASSLLLVKGNANLRVMSFDMVKK